MSGSVQSLEEAANIASEFIYSLDNLPNEVNHLLSEIKHRDTRNQELQREVDKDLLRYYRHQLRGSNSSTSNSNTGSAAVSPSPVAGIKGTGANGGSIILPAKISTAYAEMNRLADEKCELAKRLIELFSRTKARLDVDLTKVRILQGEEMDLTPAIGKLASANLAKAGKASVSMGTSGDLVVTSKSPAQEVSESLRNALTTSGSMPELAASSAASTPPAVKKRRLGATTSIKIAARAPTPPNATTTSAPLPRSRLSRQIHPPTKLSQVEHVELEAEADEEADEDEEDEEDPDAEDERLYCFCQKRSYGDMIACDNEGKCPYEWFHLPCVGLKSPIPEKWYCSECISKGSGVATGAAGRKGRKK